MPARRRHAEQVGTDDTNFGEDVSRTCSTFAAPTVMPPAIVAIAVRPLLPRRTAYAVPPNCERGSRPRHLRRKKTFEICGLRRIFPLEFVRLFKLTFSFCSLGCAATTRPQYRHISERAPALRRVG